MHLATFAEPFRKLKLSTFGPWDQGGAGSAQHAIIHGESAARSGGPLNAESQNTQSHDAGGETITTFLTDFHRRYRAGSDSIPYL